MPAESFPLAMKSRFADVYNLLQHSCAFPTFLCISNTQILVTSSVASTCNNRPQRCNSASSSIYTRQIQAWVVWDNCLCSVNYVLNKCWLASSQAGRICGPIRLEVEVGQWEQNYGKKEALSAVLSRHRKRKMWPAPLKKVASHVANIYKNNGLI